MWLTWHGTGDIVCSAADMACGAADMARDAVDTMHMQLTWHLDSFQFILNKVFSAFLGAKKHFFKKCPKRVENPN